jgi:hypothetical protein
MVRKIERDYGRFREIIKGHIKKDFRKYIAKGELTGRQGKYVVSIPLKRIRVPVFRFKDLDKVGIGQGDGQVGQAVAPGDEAGAGQGAGELPGEHMLEVEFTIEELARIMEEELGLPRIQPKGKDQILAPHHRYTSVTRVGPESLRHFKRTYREALKRAISMGIYDPDNPVVVPVREDKRFRYWKLKEIPQNNAVVIYLMDVSGSMADEQKEIVRTEAFWIDTWLRSQYKKVEVRYIVHDAVAWEVDRETFFKIRESGGTKISSAYELCTKLIRRQYDPQQWNIYPFHFSDGDNWGQEDTRRCIELLEKELLQICNVFCYGQVKSAYGSGQFKKDLDEHFNEDPRIITSEIKDRMSIYDSIKDFLGKGK